MDYQERVQRALDQIDEIPLDLSEGDSFVEDGFLIECIYSKGGNLPYSKEAYYVCVEQATNYVYFHYGGESYPDDWGFTLSMFCEVGQLVRHHYQAWLDKNNYMLEDKVLDDAPWVISVLKKKEN